MIECGACGADLPVGDGFVFDGQQIRCEDCGAQNQIAVDDEAEDEGVYVSSWRCKHGSDDESPCDLCEIEFGDGVGESAP